MAPWGLIVLQQPNALYSIVSNWPLMIIPGFALLSATWSDYPAWSLRASTQFLVTTIIGILAGSCIKPRTLLSALLSALVLITILGVLFGSYQSWGPSRIPVLVGLFGSKNYFGLAVSVLLLVAVTVAFDHSQRLNLRMIAIASAISAVPLLVISRSIGAIVVSFATLGMLSGLYLASRFHPGVRIAVLILVILTGATMFLFGMLYIDDYGQLLGFFGKDTTLTGRAHLWEHALLSIAKQPILGVGYQAFWQVGNWGAEHLWDYLGLGTVKYGIHFHNMYVNVMVDLGLVGLSMLVATFLVITVRIMTVSLARPTMEQMFAAGIFIFLFLRTPIEVDLLYAFQLPSILFCLVWIYLRSAPRLSQVAAMPRIGAKGTWGRPGRY
jgi:exopolysaccharide production protein ExoQ